VKTVIASRGCDGACVHAVGSLAVQPVAMPSGGASDPASDLRRLPDLPAVPAAQLPIFRLLSHPLHLPVARLQLASKLSPLLSGVSGAGLRLNLPPAEPTIKSRLASKIRSPGDSATDCRLSSELNCPAVRRFASRFASRHVSPVVPATWPSACASGSNLPSVPAASFRLAPFLGSSALMATQVPARA